MTALLLGLSLLSIGISLFSLRVAVGAARSIPEPQPVPETSTPSEPRYIGSAYYGAKTP